MFATSDGGHCNIAYPPELPMTSVDSIHHVAIGVTDLARARRFYSEVLGLEEMPRPAFDFAGAWFRVGRQQIHLIVRPAEPRPDRRVETRDDHIALRVRSYRETVEYLRTLGLPFEARPHNKTSRPQIYIVDPDGHTIELNAEELD